MRIFNTITVLTGLLSVAACSSIATTASFDSTAPFASYSTFKIESRSSLPAPLTREIELSLQGELGQRRLRPAESADLLVNFFTLVEDGVRVTETPTNIYVPYRRGYAVWTAYETDIQEVTEGTLFVDVVDLKTKKLVWEGSAHGVVSRGNLDRNRSKIKKAIGKMLLDFPIEEREE